MKKFLLATVSMVALTSAGRAADMPAKARIYSPAPVASWDGVYFGVQGGVARRDATSRSGFLGPTHDGSKTGGLAGAQLGYNWQQGSFVYGVEGDWNWIGAKADFFSPPGLAGYSSSYEVNWLATARGRAGLAIDSTLFYLTGGLAFGHVKDNVTFLNNTSSATVSFTQDETKAGWTVGAGVEHMFAPNWSARGEFRYVDLGKSTADCTPGTSNCVGFSAVEFNNTLMMGLVGVNYKFGDGRMADPSQARAYAPPSNPVWTGAYLGIQGGVAHHDAFFNDSDSVIGNNDGLNDAKKTGGTVGGLLGYNWQQGSFVYGVEGDWSWVGAKSDRTSQVNIFTTDSTSLDVNWLATIRGRAGLAFDATLVYFTGGLAIGHVKNSFEISNPVAGQFSNFTQDQTKVGWTAGVGVEHMFSQHWSARAEFRYADLGKTTVSCSGSRNFCVSGGNTYRGEFSNTLKLGLIGVNYKF